MTRDQGTEDPRIKDPRIEDPVHGLEFCLVIIGQRSSKNTFSANKHESRGLKASVGE